MRKERVAAYIRVSSQEQKMHGLSLPAQKDKLKEYAKKYDLEIVEWYMDEGVSGRKLIRRRPELQRMIGDAERGMFERIIFIKLDRFFRSVAEYHECMKRIDPVVWTATEEEKYDLTTANGRAFVNMKLTIAEFEADQTGERIRMVNEYKVKEGLPLTGNVSFAFKIVKGEDGRKKFIHNPETEEMAYDLIDYYEKHQNLIGTAVYLSEKYNCNVGFDKVKYFLKSTMLYGEYRGNPNYAPPYITKERFDRIQEILGRNVYVGKYNEYKFPRLIVCPECGERLNAYPCREIGHKGEIYLYKKYRCKNRYERKTCEFKKNISENVFERKMLEQIEELFAETVTNISVDAPQQDNTAAIKKIEDEIERLNYSWQKGRIKSADEYDRQYEELNARLKEMNQKKKSGPDIEKIKKILSGNWREMYNSLDVPHRRAFWRSFIRSIEIEWTTDVKRIKRINFF